MLRRAMIGRVSNCYSPNQNVDAAIDHGTSRDDPDWPVWHGWGCRFAEEDVQRHLNMESAGKDRSLLGVPRLLGIPYSAGVRGDGWWLVRAVNAWSGRVSSEAYMYVRRCKVK